MTCVESTLKLFYKVRFDLRSKQNSSIKYLEKISLSRVFN